MTTTTEEKPAKFTPSVFEKPDLFASCLAVQDQSVHLVGGTAISNKGKVIEAKNDRTLRLPKTLIPGMDYFVYLDAKGLPVAEEDNGSTLNAIGGFHVGLDEKILPNSAWDRKFRPFCRDPRGMALVSGSWWGDIYLLNTNPLSQGTSRANQEIADGYNPPVLPNGKKAAKFTWWDATLIYAHFGKQLLSLGEFHVAAQGVTEEKSCGTDPKKTVHMPAHRSSWGLEQITGCMWQWGRDVDPTSPRCLLYGGAWYLGADSGSRYSDSNFPYEWSALIGARGRCDHLVLA